MIVVGRSSPLFYYTSFSIGSTTHHSVWLCSAASTDRAWKRNTHRLRSQNREGLGIRKDWTGTDFRQVLEEWVDRNRCKVSYRNSERSAHGGLVLVIMTGMNVDSIGLQCPAQSISEHQAQPPHACRPRIFRKTAPCHTTVY